MSEWKLNPGETIVRKSLHQAFGGRGPEPIITLDVSEDGRRFFILTENPDAPAREVRVIQNFFEELNRLVPVD